MSEDNTLTIKEMEFIVKLMDQAQFTISIKKLSEEADGLAEVQVGVTAVQKLKREIAAKTPVETPEAVEVVETPVDAPTPEVV